MTTQRRGMGSIERTGDGATVRFTRHLAHPRSTVWAAITQPAQLAQWLDDASVDLRVGGAFQVRFSDATMNGVITELEAERILAYSWHEDREGRSHVRWVLSDDAQGTRLELTHTRLAADAASGFAAGWHTHLERLDARLRGEPSPWDDSRFAELHGAYSVAGAGA